MENAQLFSLDYEVDPGDNTPTPFATKAYVLYTTSDLQHSLHGQYGSSDSYRNRDEGFRDDNVLFGFDAYGDSRYMIALGTNPEGNLTSKSSNGDDENYDVN